MDSLNLKKLSLGALLIALGSCQYESVTIPTSTTIYQTTVPNNVIIGGYNYVSGDANLLAGYYNQLSGSYNTVQGNLNLLGGY